VVRLVSRHTSAPTAELTDEWGELVRGCQVVTLTCRCSQRTVHRRRSVVNEPERVTFKTAVLPYKMCQHGAAPQYLQSYCESTSTCTGRRHVRPSQMRQLVVPRTRTKYGDRIASPSKDLVSGTVYPLSCELQTFHRLYSEKKTENICSISRNCFMAFAATFLS